MKLSAIFLKSAGLLLCITGLLKIISSTGKAGILSQANPIFGITFQQVFWTVGLLELIIAAFCLLTNDYWRQSALIAWLATSFAAYRLGLLWIGYHKPCSCLGNLTDALRISPQIADTAMKIVLGYLLIGSYASLFWLWKEKRKQSPL